MPNVLNASELLYLSLLFGAEEVFGLPDVFTGKTDDEIKKMIDETAVSCTEKELISVDFDGKMKLDESIDKAIGMIATADKVTELIYRNTDERQKRYLIYYKKEERVILYESGGEYFITGESGFEKVYNGIKVLFADGHLMNSGLSGFKITADEVAEARAGAKPKSSIMRALMYDKGVDETTSTLVTNALAGRAGYFSAVTVDRLNNDIATAMFIVDYGLVCQVSSDRKSNNHYAAIDNETARQIALSFAGGNTNV